MSPDRPSRRGAFWTVVAIGLLAAALRLYGMAWGLPDLHNPDEIWILNRALSFAKGDPSPHNFLYPTLYFYVLFVWEALFYAVGRAAGLYASVAAFQREFFVDPSHLVMAGRALTALFGTLTVVAVYRFGARLYGRTTGVCAALFLAVAPFAVRDAHYIKHDVPVTLFVVLTQVAVARLVVDASAAARRVGWLAAGAMSGLAVSTHYYAFPVVFPIVAAAIIDARRTGRWQTSFGRLVWAGVASVAAFLATTPFFLVELKTVVRDMVAVRQIDVDRAVAGAGAFASLGAYLRMMATDAVGWTVGLAAAIGLLVAPIIDWRRGVALLCFPLAFLAFLANTVPMNRYLNPMLPSLAVAAALVVTRGASRLGPRVSIAAGAAALIVAVPGGLASVRSDRFFRQADTRTLARQFIERTVPKASSVLVQPHQVQLRPTRAALIEALRANLGSESLASIKFQNQLAAASDVGPAFRVIYLGKVTDGGLAPDTIYLSPEAIDAARSLQPLRDLQVAYVAVNRYNSGNSAFGSLYSALQREAHLLQTFSPYRADVSPDRQAAVAPFFHNTADRIDPALERPGPIVELWRIN